MDRKIHDILNADTDGLRELMGIANGDPRTFFVGARMDGVDIRGQDLRGINFDHADWRGVIADSETLVDDAYKSKFENS